MRKHSTRSVGYYQPKSGTKVAYHYAKQKNFDKRVGYRNTLRIVSRNVRAVKTAFNFFLHFNDFSGDIVVDYYILRVRAYIKENRP